jgi:hypothetical protein
MRSFEDFIVGEVMTFGPIAVTAEDIKSFAERFDPSRCILTMTPGRTLS